ncbi:MAG: translation initiation factor IF-2 [Lachnospiraceae bacterium]
MPKSRIYEIAQELNKTNKEVIEFLKEKKVEVKSHMSTLEEKDEKMVRDAFTGKNEGKEEKKEAADRPKKKSNLIQVFRPQNAQTQEGKNFRRNKPQSDRNGQDRPARGNGEGSRSGYQNRDNQNRDGQERRFNGQGRRDNQNRDGQSRDGQERRFNGQGRRDNQNRDGQSRDGQERRFNGQGRRDNQNRDGQNRDNQGGRRFDNRNGQNNNRYQGQNNRQDGGNGSRRFDGNRDGQNRDNQNRDNQGGRRFDNNRNGMNRDNRDRDGRENNGRRNERRDSRPAMDSMDLGLARKPVRDVKNKEKDKEKEREREEKKTQDRRNGQGSNRPNQGRFQKSRLPKALQKPARPQPKEEKKEVVKEITLPEKMTIRELAEKMKMQPAVIVKKLFMEGTMVTVNHEIDFEKAQEIALDYDIIAEQEEKVDVIEELLKEEEEDPKDLVPRPPVVCVMGHVDHGKTSLLDAIRKTNVTDREAGGITQHIGAYVVSIKGQKITFLDTPGHEAFTAMRMRGANSTDIAVLVVAADDGVMPQTVEAINHAKAAGVEIIVAINKVDKPSANIERVKQELSEYELIPEDWGGSTIFVPVSAKTHQGIEELLEMILLTSEVCELKANPKRKARGLVIEAQLDKGKGPVATILVQKGTLHVGDFIAAGASSGKVRAMMDDKGRRVKEAGPSTPVEILGLSDVPNAGEVLVATENDKEAKNFAATFISENKNRLLEETKAKMSLDDLFSQIQEGNLKELNLIVKADVQGSVEAVKQSLVKLSNDEVVVKVIHGGVGAINESDVTLASASNAIIIGFNVRPDATAKATAEQEGVDLRLYRVIYQAIEDVEAAMKGMLDPVFEEKVIGHAEVRQIFKASGVGNIAGSYVLDGVFQRGCTVRISREGKQIFEGPLASLKRFKDDVKEVKAGYECGLVFEGFNDIQELDQVEAYIMVEVPR